MSEESVGCHQATSGVVARLKVVAWRPALRPVHHASHDAASDTALQLRQTSLTQELAAAGKTIKRNSHGFDLIEATWVTKKDQEGKNLFPKKVGSNIYSSLKGWSQTILQYQYLSISVSIPQYST